MATQTKPWYTDLGKEKGKEVERTIQRHSEADSERWKEKRTLVVPKKPEAPPSPPKPEGE